MPSYRQSVTYANARVNQPIEVWGNAKGDNVVGGAYALDFGDGSAPLKGSVANPKYMGANHTYTTAGLKSITLIVTDTLGITDTSESLIRVFPTPATREVEINIAIEKGLLYLYKSQNAAGWWLNNTYYGLGASGLALLAFEENGHLPTNNIDEDIYAETVIQGINWLVSGWDVVSNVYAHNDGTAIQRAYVQSDTLTGNIVGASFWAQNNHDHYTNACAALGVLGGFRNAAVAQSHTVDNAGSLFNGWTYYELMERVVDRFAFTQEDGTYRGNWRYQSNVAQPQSNEVWDGSAMQWPEIVMMSAEPAWGIETPQWVRDNVWYAYTQIQNPTSGGVGYDSATSWVNMAKTGGLVGAAVWNNIPMTNTRVVNALKYLGDNYLQPYDVGWVNHLYGMYAIKKGLQFGDVLTLTHPTAGVRDWYDDFAAYLLAKTAELPPGLSYTCSTNYACGQRADGSWIDGAWTSGYPDLGTAWGILILTKGVLIPPPVAIIADISPHPTNASILFDGSQSYHMDGDKAIVQYLWDWDASDGLDWDNPDATGLRAVNPGYSTEGTRTVTLRVRDNGSPAMYDNDTFNIQITPGNHPPVAVAIPAARLPNYSGAVNAEILLDGRESYDPDAGDAIAAYAWDLDGDLAYDDAFGSTVLFSKTAPYLGQVGLLVTDTNGLTNTNLAYADVIIVLNMDLSVESLDVVAFSNDTVSVQATFANAPTSTQNASNVLVRFYDNDPFTGNVLGGDYRVDLPVGGTDTVNATFAIPRGLGRIYVRLDANEQIFESDELNNIANAQVYLSKRSNPLFPIPGAPLTYTLSFANGAQVLATNVRITDTIPAELQNPTIVGSSGAVITATPGHTFAWQVADLAPGEGGVITIRGTVDAGLDGGDWFTNTATMRLTLGAETVTRPATLGFAVPSADSDGDGIPDVDEGSGDSDGDGVRDYLDLDSDGDGLPDVEETGNGALDADHDGLLDDLTDNDGDGLADVVDPDQGGTAVSPARDSDGDGTPDYLDLDSDNDGLDDIDETTGSGLDGDDDGVIDDLTDTDGDGLADAVDPDNGGTPTVPPIDSDGDGLPDYIEPNTTDTDGDGVFDYLDTDSDGDGLPDGYEGGGDTDGDGTPDYLDLDSDGDGLDDIDEWGNGSLDADNDGVIDDQTDTDGDGLADSVDPDDGGTAASPAPDTDGDGAPDFQDVDSDGDGILDATEGTTDTDGDNVPDRLEDNSADTDGDGTPNHQDADDDGDGIPTANEDDDGDGYPANDDTDGDGTPDYLDIDSDGDGIADVTEVDAGTNPYDPTDNDTAAEKRATLVDASDATADGAPLVSDLTNTGLLRVVPSSIGAYEEGFNDPTTVGLPAYVDPDNPTQQELQDVIDGINAATDTDRDGISDADELDRGSDPNDPDDPSPGGADDDDGDGLTNGEEGFDPNGDGDTSDAQDTDGDGTPDYQDTDSDDDGVSDEDETAQGSDPTDPDDPSPGGGDDADNDGLTNGQEGFDPNGDGDTSDAQDTDGDGTPDYQDTDSDDDGFDDDVEGTMDSDGDTVPDRLEDNFADTDGDGTANYQDNDDDGDGIPTADEDANGDGNPANDDTDGDGTPDYLDEDSDGDGIPDEVEGNGDTDGDGTPDFQDTDSDGDGIPDEEEGAGDADGDGTPDYQDTDSDNDGTDDDVEGATDSDGDTVPDRLEDNDADTDGDGTNNHLDDDDDGDGIPTADEDANGDGNPANDDSDGDGTPDYLDEDSDGDGIPDAVEGEGDADGDGTPNYLDDDSDGDGIPDDQEGDGDADGDGTPDFLDDNANPSVSDIANQFTLVGTPISASFTITDADDPLDSLVLYAESSNLALVNGGLAGTVMLGGGISFSGSGAERTITITPMEGVTGTTTITVTVDDGKDIGIDTFVLSVGAQIADLEIIKSYVRGPDAVTYTIVARNLGPSDAAGAIVHDDIAAHITNVSWTCAAAGGAACAASGSGNTLDEALTSFPVGGVVTYTVTGGLGIFQDESNTATILAPVGVDDPVAANNSSVVGLPYRYLLVPIFRNATP